MDDFFHMALLRRFILYTVLFYDYYWHQSCNRRLSPNFKSCHLRDTSTNMNSNLVFLIRTRFCVSDQKHHFITYTTIEHSFRALLHSTASVHTSLIGGKRSTFLLLPLWISMGLHKQTKHRHYAFTIPSPNFLSFINVHHFLW